jgi:hypothetical protein
MDDEKPQPPRVPPRHCLNCQATLPDGAALCPNCGWDSRSPYVSPLLPKAGSPVQMAYQEPGGNTVWGVLLGSVLTWCLWWLFLAGPIISLIVYFSVRKDKPSFARGILIGILVGAIGVVACFLTFARPPWGR